MGDRTELLVHFFLNTIAFTTPVPRQEDVGHDLLCVLTEPNDNLLWAGPSFTVQVKSTADPLIFEKEHEVAWIKQLENPFFIALGDKKELRVTLYSTWQRMKAFLYREVKRIEFRLSSPNCGHPSVVTDENASTQTVYLGEPIISATLPESLDQSHAEKLRQVLKEWIKIDRQNIACNQADITGLSVQLATKQTKRLQLTLYRFHSSGTRRTSRLVPETLVARQPLSALHSKPVPLSHLLTPSKSKP